MAAKHPPQLSLEQIRWYRLRRSGLHTAFADAPAAASALFGIQAQIHPAAGLALQNRTRALTQPHVDHLLYTDRSLVKLWGQRGTLHLYTAGDWPMLYAANRVRRTWGERLAQRNGHPPQKYRRLARRVANLLRRRETLGRSDLRASNLPLGEEMLSPWGGIFADVVHMGAACHVQRSNGEARFAHRERWLPNLDWSPPTPAVANRTIAARYFHSYGPAAPQDFSYWRGVPLRTAQPWLQPLRSTFVEVRYKNHLDKNHEAGETLGLLSEEDLAAAQITPPPPEAWPVRLLYRFDPYLLAHREKAWAVAPDYYDSIWRPAGHIEGVLLVHGCAQGIWRYTRKGRSLEIQVRPFTPLPLYVQNQLEPLAQQVADFFMLPLRDLHVAQPAVAPFA